MSLLNKLKNAKEQYIDKNENMQNILAKTKSLANEATEKLKEMTNKDSNKNANNLQELITETQEQIKPSGVIHLQEKAENIMLDSALQLKKIIHEAYQAGYAKGYECCNKKFTEQNAECKNNAEKEAPYKVETQDKWENVALDTKLNAETQTQVTEPKKD